VVTTFAGKPAPLATAGSRRVYDAIVLGPDVGGAAAGALLARRGLRVLLAPLTRIGGARESEGWLLPASHPMIPPLRQLPAASAAIDDLGLGQDLVRQAASTAGAFQLLGEKLRLSLPAEQERRRSELLRELGEEGAQRAEQGLDALEGLGRPWDPFLIEPPPYPPRGFFERRKLRKTLPVAPPLPDGLIGEALAAVAPFAAQAVGDAAPEATARLGAALLRAPLRLWGGAAQLGELLREKALASSAELLYDQPSHLVLERKGVVLQLGGAEVRASALILACDSKVVASICSTGGRTERRLAEEAQMPVQRKVALAHFVVRAEGLPLALEEAALLLGQPGGPLAIAALPARKVKGEAQGERLLTVARVVDAAESDGPRLIESIRAALEPVLPFFDRHIVHQEADLELALPHPIFAPREDGEPLGLRPQSEAHDRALFASSGVYPGFGLEGQLLAARACAATALSLSGRKVVAAV
jgi:hypothetical protein